MQTQGNILPNFFFKVPTESGLLGPKIALRYFWDIKFFIFLIKGDFMTDWFDFSFLQTLPKKLSVRVNFLME